MHPTESAVIATVRGDAASLVIAIALCTIGAAMLLLGALSARGSRASFVYSGLFALAYGSRLMMNTSTFGILSDRPFWLAYVRSALEYLVPVPAALLFQSFTTRSRLILHRVTTGALMAWAAIAIPFEIANRVPYAGKPVIDVLIVVLLAVFSLDLLATGGESDWRLVRAGAIVFVAFVANEHMRLIQDPYGITREPTGFLFLMVTIVFTTLQRGARAQHRLVGVDSELAAARVIQQSTLPEASPRLPGLEIATIYTPASDVAGDFYDFVELDDGSLGVFIADVSGHGMPAALVASMLKIALATQEANASSPARVMAALNVLFCGRLKRQFITAAYAHIDPAAGTIVLASAGHPPPILLHAGETGELLAPGVILGRFRGARYEEVSMPFEPGDALILYTDGVTETTNPATEQWGDQRLRNTIAAHGDEAADRLTRIIVEEVAAWRDVRTAPDDDVTLVAVKRLA